MSFAYTEVKKLFKERFDIDLKDKHQYEIAFTHSSYANEHRDKHLEYNERIEYLGDAVLQLTVSNYLYRHFPEDLEGDLSRLRSLIVREESLAKRCLECGFEAYIQLGKGEENSGARKRPSLLCDLFESVVGALYLDRGLEVVENFLNQVLYPLIEQGEFHEELDSKTLLQERLQENGPIQLSYQLISERENEGTPQFEMAVYLKDKKIGQGVGRSKKAAEQAAAKQALKTYQN